MQAKLVGGKATREFCVLNLESGGIWPDAARANFCGAGLVSENEPGRLVTVVAKAFRTHHRAGEGAIQS